VCGGGSEITRAAAELEDGAVLDAAVDTLLTVLDKEECDGGVGGAKALPLEAMEVTAPALLVTTRPVAVLEFRAAAVEEEKTWEKKRAPHNWHNGEANTIMGLTLYTAWKMSP
jgi:hypothetical protein